MDIDPHHALMGVEPGYNRMMTRIEKMGLGNYTGGFHDRWDWNKEEVKKLSDENAYMLYRDIVNYKEGPDPHDQLFDLKIKPGQQIIWLHNNDRLDLGHYAGHPVDTWRWHYSAVKKLSDTEAKHIFENLIARDPDTRRANSE